jgi:hypothetical protein
LPDQIGERALGVRTPRVGQVLRDEIAEAQRFVESRTRTSPPSEVTRDPWNSTFNVGLKES